MLEHITLYEHFLSHKSQWNNNNTDHYYTEMYIVLLVSIWVMNLKLFPILEDWRVGAHSSGDAYLMTLCLGWALIRGDA